MTKNIRALTNELAQKSGVSEAEVEKVLTTLGVNSHYHEATTMMGREPTLDDVKLSYRINRATIVK